MRKITIVAVLLYLSSCASGSGTRPPPRPSGPVAPCPAYANFETARVPDGRGWSEVVDSIARTPDAQGPRSRRPARNEWTERETSELFGLTITHPARVRPGDRQYLAQLFEQTYPPDLRDRGLGGTVYVVMLLDPHGAVRETRVARTSMYPSLDAAAVRVAQRIIFDPAIAGTCSLPYIVSLPNTYRVSTPADPGRRP